MDVRLRPVTEDDLPVFFEQQRDPIANTMADFPAREREAFHIHWRTRVLVNPAGFARTILCDGAVAGNIVSFIHSGEREVGYWLGREFWGRGIATRALEAFLAIETTRPLHAFAVHHNLGSIRVLEKCGFVRAEQDAEGVTLIRYT
ncbi:MAG: GNAT family N-acetyltransferase [Anaerolineae bacterium]|nr:GNAT family N-acetyltransferase [Anaerolineae bacterium]HQV29227.1 GNAT family N-acetyltransferase [Thermoflexales bacterium]